MMASESYGNDGSAFIISGSHAALSAAYGSLGLVSRLRTKYPSQLHRSTSFVGRFFARRSSPQDELVASASRRLEATHTATRSLASSISALWSNTRLLLRAHLERRAVHAMKTCWS